ncbi:MAG TPA: periplasmic heavy metal sensor [Burkholderiales bacterium]|nr:periplasmic heavy metal sensor [Burkholderiales bacterium]
MDQPNHEATANGKKTQRRPFLKGMLAGGLVGTLLAGGVGAFAQHHPHAGFWKAGCSQRHAMHDPGVMRERADFMVEYTLKRIDATEEQRTQVKSIVQGAIEDLMQLRAEHQTNRREMIAALIEPSVDRAELDRIRDAEMALMDRGSQRIVTALADAADALTPEQRAQLARMAERWTGHSHKL